MDNGILQKKLLELMKLADDSGIDITSELDKLENKIADSSRADTAWTSVELARHPERPYSLDYINRIFDDFTELHGDRYFGDDPAIIGGLAFLDEKPVTIIAHQKGRTIKERIHRNGGWHRQCFRYNIDCRYRRIVRIEGGNLR